MPVLDLFYFSWPLRDEKQSRPLWDLNSDCKELKLRQNTGSYILWVLLTHNFGLVPLFCWPKKNEMQSWLQWGLSLKPRQKRILQSILFEVLMVLPSFHSHLNHHLQLHNLESFSIDLTSSTISSQGWKWDRQWGVPQWFRVSAVQGGSWIKTEKGDSEWWITDPYTTTTSDRRSRPEGVITRCISWWLYQWRIERLWGNKRWKKRYWGWNFCGQT